MERSLGWISESAILPRRPKVIGGVSASTIVDLKAVLFEAEEEARRFHREYGLGSLRVSHSKRRKKVDGAGVGMEHNTGVETRRAMDDRVEERERQSGSELMMMKRMERKAALYEKFSRGEGIKEYKRDGGMNADDELEDDGVLVDFERKMWEEGEGHKERENTHGKRQRIQRMLEEGEGDHTEKEGLYPDDEGETDSRRLSILEKMDFFERLGEERRAAREKILDLRKRKKKAIEWRIKRLRERLRSSSHLNQ